MSASHLIVVLVDPASGRSVSAKVPDVGAAPRTDGVLGQRDGKLWVSIGGVWHPLLLSS